MARQRLLGEPFGEVGELARRAAAVDRAVMDGSDAGRIIAAIFEPLQPLEQAPRDVRHAQDTDDSAHGSAILQMTYGTWMPGIVAGKSLVLRVTSRAPFTRAVARMSASSSVSRVP